MELPMDLVRAVEGYASILMVHHLSHVLVAVHVDILMVLGGHIVEDTHMHIVSRQVIKM